MFGSFGVVGYAVELFVCFSVIDIAKKCTGCAHTPLYVAKKNFLEDMQPCMWLKKLFWRKYTPVCRLKNFFGAYAGLYAAQKNFLKDIHPCMWLKKTFSRIFTPECKHRQIFLAHVVSVSAANSSFF